jgi:single-stranded DNA-binding protein
MIKMIVTKAVISKGFDGAAALRFSENAENPSVRFRIGVLVYDKRAEKERRFVNIGVKAFGYHVDRIKSMQLDAGSYVNILGRYDEDTWEDQTTREKKSAPVLIVDDIEYGASNGNGKQNGEPNGASNGTSPANGHAPTPAAAPPPAGNGQPPGAFTGFENFGGANPYFTEG